MENDQQWSSKIKGRLFGKNNEVEDGSLGRIAMVMVNSLKLIAVYQPVSSNDGETRNTRKIWKQHWLVEGIEGKMKSFDCGRPECAHRAPEERRENGGCSRAGIWNIVGR